jgi:enoyl-CoA hydratase/carnithine racemase
MDYQHILVQRIDHIATVTFNRPPACNALNYAHLAKIALRP